MRDEIQEIALREALKHKRSGLGLGTGVGKTRIGLSYVDHFYTDSLRVQLLAPTLGIFKEWKNEAEKVNCKYLLDHINFSTYLSIDNCSLEADILILEEFHHLIEASHDPWLSRFQGRILGLSGTPPKYEKSEKGKMMNKYCPLVYEYGVDNAIGDKILNDYRIVVHPLKLGTDKSLWKAKKTGGGWFTSEVGDYQSMTRWVNNASSGKERQISQILRMKALMMYKTKEDYAKVLFGNIPEKAILFANETDQCDRMTTFTYHSKNIDSEENLKLFRTDKIMKLGCVQMLSEGVNIQGLKQAVIMHSFSANSPKSFQKLGRLLRLNPDDVATLHFLVYQDTIDQQWLDGILSDVSPDKISYKQLTQ